MTRISQGVRSVLQEWSAEFGDVPLMVNADTVQLQPVFVNN